MQVTGYIVQVTTSHHTATNSAVQKMAGIRHLLIGVSNDERNHHLFVFPGAHQQLPYFITSLKELPGFIKVSLLSCSHQIKTEEYLQIRKVLEDMDMDVATVRDEDFSLLIHSKLQGQNGYYIDTGRKRNRKGKFIATIRRLEEHPEFSEKWRNAPVQEKEQMQQSLQSIEEITKGYGLIIRQAKEAIPPPPLPTELFNGTDEEIKRWFRDNDPRKPGAEDIEIQRAPGKISITLITGNVTIESWITQTL